LKRVSADQIGGDRRSLKETSSQGKKREGTISHAGEKSTEKDDCIKVRWGRGGEKKNDPSFDNKITIVLDPTLDNCAKRVSTLKAKCRASGNR